MRRFLCICLLLQVGFSAGAQERSPRFSGTVTAGVGLPLNTPAATPFGVYATGYYHMIPRLWAGVSAGVSVYDRTVLVPLTGVVRWEITRPRRFTPFLECGAGYGFAPASGFNGGFLLTPSVGVRMSVARRQRAVQLSVGYESQKLQRLRTYGDNLFTYQYQERLNHSSLKIAVGYWF